VQRATAEQLGAQAQAAKAALAELRAQPRPESLAVVRAQVEVAEATLKMSKDPFDKLEGVNRLTPNVVSRDQLDTAANAVRVATANLAVAHKQYDLTRAGAWSYDIQAQTQQYVALDKAYRSARALLEKYTIRAPVDGSVLSIQTAVGSYVSAQGTYDTISGSNAPVQLSSERAERVDLRVLPVIFRLKKPSGVQLYPGQLVDVYIGEPTVTVGKR